MQLKLLINQANILDCVQDPYPAENRFAKGKRLLTPLALGVHEICFVATRCNTISARRYGHRKLRANEDEWCRRLNEPSSLHQTPSIQPHQLLPPSSSGV